MKVCLTHGQSRGYPEEAARGGGDHGSVGLDSFELDSPGLSKLQLSSLY